MKSIRRDLNSNKMIYRKYIKNYRHNMNVLTFLKSNYKYKRRTKRCHINSKQQKWQWSLPSRQQKQKRIKHKHKLPAEEETLTDDKQITRKSLFYENIKFDKFLRIFILIMQQTTPTNNYNNNNNNSRMVTRLVAKMKAIKNVNKSLPNVNMNEEDKNENDVEDCINENQHHAYKDANKDTDINVDISNITDEISHQQHNYDKVSTIKSTPIKCQRRKHHQIKTTHQSPSSSSSSSSFSLTTKTTTATISSTLLSSPSIANYETCQWSPILRHYVCDNPSFHQHQYQHKIKHIHTQNHYHHALHIKSLMTRRVPNINNSRSSNYSSRTISNTTVTGTNNIYQSVDQYVNATWNRSYTLSCLLLTLFIAFTIGVRSTTAGACWQTVLDNGKCNEIFSLNISKSECCGANQEFAYTEREPTNVEYFFATAIGGGMECSPCLESCKNVKCGPNKKCVKRKGRPKCICAPECGAARRKRKQRENIMLQEQQPQQQSHTLHLVDRQVKDNKDDEDDEDDHGGDGYFPDVAAAMRSSNAFKIKIEKSQQSRDTRSLSSEITNINLGLENGKDAMMIKSGETSPMERHHGKEHNQNQRKTKHIHMHHLYDEQQRQYIQQQQEQQPNHKYQEPKGSRRLLITANVEHTEKPTTRRLQILSNVRTTHARRHNSNNNKKRKNEHGQHEDTDPSDYVEENDDEDYNENTEDDAKETIKKNINNSNSNSNNNKNKNHNNNRNDDSTRFLNQSPSRHKLKTNTKSNNNNNSNSNSNKNNKNRNNSNNKNQHDLQRTKIQQHSSKNNTRVRHPQQNGHHAENTPHHRHHNNNHHSHHQHQHHRQQHQQNNRNHQQQSENHGRHKHNNGNKQHHKQQTIVLKMPKNNKDYNITTTTTSNIAIVNTTATNSDTDATATDVSSTTLLQHSRLGKMATTSTSLNLSIPSAAIAPTNTTTTTTMAFNTPPKHIQSQLLFLSTSSATSSLSSTTPVNSTMSADDDYGGNGDSDDGGGGSGGSSSTADDHYHRRLPNHGNKLATSSLLSATSSSTSSLPSPSSSSHLQLSAASARSSSESAVVQISAKGEGVSLHDHKHHIEIPTKIPFKNSNNNNDNIISALQSNLHNTQQEQQQQQQDQQQHTQSTQSQQHHYQTPLFDGFTEQFDLIGFPNKKHQQQTITNGDIVRPLNPVCGTDGRTYNTECQLRKRACRTDNPNLQISYRGHCRTTCNGVKCLNGLTCVEDQYSMPHCIACKIECPQDDYDNDVVDATRAVCGADGKTYKSTCDINRMICKIGRSIGVAYPGPCREEQVTCDDINCGPKQVCLIDLLTHKPRCTSCRYKCSRKRRPSYHQFEEGKICGFNNHTYNSWCEMLKDSCSTGFYIDVKYSGACH